MNSTELFLGKYTYSWLETNFKFYDEKKKNELYKLATQDNGMLLYEVVRSPQAHLCVIHNILRAGSPITDYNTLLFIFTHYWKYKNMNNNVIKECYKNMIKQLETYGIVVNSPNIIINGRKFDINVINFCLDNDYFDKMIKIYIEILDDLNREVTSNDKIVEKYETNIENFDIYNIYKDIDLYINPNSDINKKIESIIDFFNIKNDNITYDTDYKKIISYIILNRSNYLQYNTFEKAITELSTDSQFKRYKESLLIQYIQFGNIKITEYCLNELSTNYLMIYAKIIIINAIISGNIKNIFMVYDGLLSKKGISNKDIINITGQDIINILNNIFIFHLEYILDKCIINVEQVSLKYKLIKQAIQLNNNVSDNRIKININDSQYAYLKKNEEFIKTTKYLRGYFSFQSTSPRHS